MSVLYQKKVVFILFLLSIASLLKINGQESSALYFLNGVPQASLENPAFQNKTGKLVIGIPALSGININVNSNMAIDYLFSDEFEYWFEKLHEYLGEGGKMHAGARAAIFFASLKHNDYTFSLSVSERMISNTFFDQDIIRLLNDGINDFYGLNQSIGTAFFQFRHFKELGIGLSREISEGFDVGIRPKLLYGKYLLDTQKFEVFIETDSQNQELMIYPQGTYFMSGPLSYNGSFRSNILPGDYFFQPKNLGFAIDAGFSWKTGKATELSASIIDAGAIGFRHNIFDMKMNRAWRYTSNELYQSNEPESENYRDPREALVQFADSISYLLEIEEGYKRKISLLPMKINAAAYYHLSQKTSVGVANQFSWYRHNPVNMFSFIANKGIGNRLEIAGNFSVYNLSYFTTGFGAVYSARWMQVYFASNNILGIIHPSSTKHLNLSLGMNFLIDTQ